MQPDRWKGVGERGEQGPMVHLDGKSGFKSVGKRNAARPILHSEVSSDAGPHNPCYTIYSTGWHVKEGLTEHLKCRDRTEILWAPLIQQTRGCSPRSTHMLFPAFLPHNMQPRGARQRASRIILGAELEWSLWVLLIQQSRFGILGLAQMLVSQHLSQKLQPSGATANGVPLIILRTDLEANLRVSHITQSRFCVFLDQLSSQLPFSQPQLHNMPPRGGQARVGWGTRQ